MSATRVLSAFILLATGLAVLLGEITPRGYVLEASGNLQPQLDFGRLSAETAAVIGYAFVLVGVVLRRIRPASCKPSAPV